MSRARAIQPGAARVRMNLTPMIDMTFLLIVFFILTSQISNVEMAEEIELPEPKHSVAAEPDEEHRVVINLIPDLLDKRRVASMRLGFRTFNADAAGRAALRAELLAAVQRDAEVKIDIRADRQASYSEVYPILNAASASGARRVDLVVAASLPGAAPRQDEGGGP